MKFFFSITYNFIFGKWSKNVDIFSPKMLEHYYLGPKVATRSKISEKFYDWSWSWTRLTICFIGTISFD